MTRENRKRLNMIDKITKDKSKYPYLNKVIKWQSVPRLKNFLILADKREIDSNTLIHENKYPYFTLTIKELMKRYGGSQGTWNRNINLFVALGLIGKRNPYEVNSENGLLFQHSMQGKVALARKLNVPISKLKEQNLYYLIPYTDQAIQVAEDRAKVMYENGFSTKSFSKIFLQRVFGLEFANTVFFNNIQESDFTLAVFNEIELVLLEQLKKKHYSYKEEIINYVAIDTDTYRHYEEAYKTRRFDNRKAIAEFEFGRSIQIICNKHDLGYAMSNKKMKVIFGLKKNKKIIYDKAYFSEMEKSF